MGAQPGLIVDSRNELNGGFNFFGMFELTGVSFGVGLDLVAECGAKLP